MLTVDDQVTADAVSELPVERAVILVVVMEYSTGVFVTVDTTATHW